MVGGMTPNEQRPAALLVRVALVAALLAASGYALGFKTDWAFSERLCPPDHVEQYLGLMGGVWRCLPVGVTPAAGDDAWWNSLPQGHRTQRIGVYLANLQVRVFTYDDAIGVHFIGVNVPAPSY